ncbi:collagen-like protein [Maribacter sp. ANRC-HE7]|uniref:Collagen-like protein n=1 Tax=Maribacter aquimaris TaxID=2737171 RepID=A0ABR7UZ48_9FLAO|nr:collagen-like protein [Maribacter aquimaris]MBD0777355.1 collagen-like protein [Maribacter aquimaris]
MKFTVKLLGMGLVLLALMFTSCAKDGEDGMDGAMGPVGTNGIDGVDGTDGEDGADGADGANGADGTDGVDGEDGADGNANVTSQNFDISGHSGTTYQLATTMLTADNVENGVILAYLRINNEWYQIPNQQILTNGFSLIDISSYFSPIGSSYRLNLAFSRDGLSYSISAGDLDELRLVSIPSNSNTTGKQSINGNIDLTDYHAVMQYYNLNE